MDTTIIYKSMGIWTEVEVVTQSFTSGPARAILTVRPTPAKERPKGLKRDHRGPIQLMLSQSEMRRLALQLLMETLG